MCCIAEVDPSIFTTNLSINLLFYFIYIHTQSHPHIHYFPLYPLVTRFVISGVGTHFRGIP